MSVDYDGLTVGPIIIPDANLVAPTTIYRPPVIRTITQYSDNLFSSIFIYQADA